MARLRPLLAVAIGGIAGSLTRWGLLTATGDERFTITVFALNVIGSVVMGVAIGHRERLDNDRFICIGTGFAGGLTTFSTYAVAVASKLENGELFAAATDGVGTVIAATVAGGLGFRVARLSGSRRTARRQRAEKAVR